MVRNKDFWMMVLFSHMICVISGPLACFRRHRERSFHYVRPTKTRPDYVQMKRCCGAVPYHASKVQCCQNNQTRTICEEWSRWQPWSSCSVTCGIGTSLRYRECAVGQGCKEHSREEKPCRMKKCRAHCHSCSASASNFQCNVAQDSCQTREGEGCQNLVRKENNLYLIEKRCKQLKACLIQGRTLAMQGECEPNKNRSLCIYCCSGDYCNSKTRSEIPTWYRTPWVIWIYQLDSYASWLHRHRNTGVNKKLQAPLLLRNFALDPAKPRMNIDRMYSEQWKNRLSSPGVDEAFISAIVDTTEVQQGDISRNLTVASIMKSFLEALEQQLPKHFRVNQNFIRRWKYMA